MNAGVLSALTTKEMVAKTSAKAPKDHTISFDSKSGVFIQGSFHRALFFVDGITIDILDYDEETTASDISKWVEEKRILFNKEKASTWLQPDEA